MSDESPGEGGDDGDAFERVVSRVRERVDPSEEEWARMREVVAALTERAEDAVADLCPGADVMQVGSTARGTWVAGDRDVDLFVRFPPEVDREDLEAWGLEVGHAVLPEGREEYAEHPYVKGQYRGFDVDCVPCYAVESASEIRSAVDRTPFHNEYLEARLDDDLAGEVRVTKQFLKGVGVYGSDLRTRGFSGYVTELLVAEYGGFREFVEAVADWHPPVEIDPEGHAAASFDDALVVVDPTDPERNVAAVCSAGNVARLQHHARALLAAPSVERFEATDPEPLSAADVREHVDRRGTTPMAVAFSPPDLVDDQLWPQLRRSEAGLVDELDRRGFDVLRSATFATQDRSAAAILVELEVAERPRVRRHEGPPVHVADHARGFYEKYAADPDAYGPFVADGRYVVEREREHTTAEAFLESDAVFDVRLGTHVESALEAGYDVLVDDAVATLAEDFGVELAAYFHPEP
ncbi:CCA tRNA nucleotidyltransferase [Halorubellus sp. JP-L1]|uniref:CCA tRNA nucleotidyltransferase n=1 Tax=Halorubellus sp. JP-L1 TaxID=2715753 RepID=UPI00140774B3|nr:CCA tRNA nucleotidyltransferase [Halorubellus sp. JP-L1]NHN41631.1 CCA tRNA nucleotidyltransferase [Halorubellus sp. JP-L1]